jgi:DNA-binding CsgD family transcriptional regulator
MRTNSVPSTVLGDPCEYCMSLVAGVLAARDAAELTTALTAAFENMSINFVQVVEYWPETGDLNVVLDGAASGVSESRSSDFRNQTSKSDELIHEAVRFMTGTENQWSIESELFSPSNDSKFQGFGRVVGVDPVPGVRHLFVLHTPGRLPRVVGSNAILFCLTASLQLMKIKKLQNQSHFVLTPREKQCVKMTAMGLTEKEIASRMGVSPNTIRVHIENLKRKCGARNKCHAIAICISAGFVNVTYRSLD